MLTRRRYFKNLHFIYALAIGMTMLLACGENDKIEAPAEPEPEDVPVEDLLGEPQAIPPGPQDEGGPALALEAPWRDGNFSFLRQETASIQVRITPQNGATIATITLQWSGDMGQTWQPIACEFTAIGLVHSCAFRPLDHNLDQSTASVIRVVATDDQDRTGSATALNAFGIADQAFTFADHIIPVLKEDCSPCHDRDGDNDDLFRWGLYKINGVGAGELSGKIAQRVQLKANPMPPAPAAPVPVAGRQTLQLWHWQGAAETAPATPANLAFVAPASAATANDQNMIPITVSLSDTSATTRWSLYYSPTAGATYGGKLILGDNPVDQLTIDWDMSGIPAGDYYVYAIVTDGNKVPQKISLPHKLTSTSAVVAPALALTGVFAEGDSFVPIAEAVTVTIGEEDPQSFYKLAHSNDSGATWSEEIPCPRTTGGCTWDTSTLMEGIKYRVRLTATNNFDLKATATTAADFGVTGKSYSFAADIEPKFQSTCAGAGCHPRAQLGSWDLTEADTIAKANDLYSRVVNGSMPKNGPEWSAADKQSLRLWLWQALADE